MGVEILLLIGPTSSVMQDRVRAENGTTEIRRPALVQGGPGRRQIEGHLHELHLQARDALIFRSELRF